MILAGTLGTFSDLVAADIFVTLGCLLRGVIAPINVLFVLHTIIAGKITAVLFPEVMCA